MTNVLHSNMRLAKYSTPTRILVADDFLAPSVYRSVCAGYNKILTKGLKQSSGTRPPGVFWKREEAHEPLHGTYDAYVCPIEPKPDSPGRVFYSRALHSWIREQFAMPIMDDVSAVFHHHAIGSQDGWVHTDYGTEIWRRRPLKSGIQQCLERKGGVNERHFAGARAIAAIYYFQNDHWLEGDGGETAFFENPKDNKPAIKIAPLNNRMLIFETSPSSWHAFRSNRSKERSSAMLFFYSELKSGAKPAGENIS